MSANLENSAVAQDWKRSIFVPIPKKNKHKKTKWPSEEDLQTAKEEREGKAREKGEDTPN